MLDLSVLDYQDDGAWRWRLSDADGTVLARNQVRLDRGSTEFRLLTDLYRNLWRLEADPARRPRSEQDLLSRVGRYIAGQVLGPVQGAIAARAPVTVRVMVPPAAVGLLAMPLELARGGDGPLAQHGTVFCYRPEGQPADDDRGATDRLRVLAVFARPETSSALGLVQERRTLVRVLQDDPAARGALPADLHVLQYGATKDTVQATLAEAGGWDVIHLAGHGAPGRLYLEDTAGGLDPVETAELLGWLAPNRGRTRLVVLSACESGVARAVRILGPRRRPPPQPAMTGATTALGYEVARTLGCTVLATRYPVDDQFSVAFGRMWYEALARDGLPADEAVRAVLPRALRAAPGTPLSLATTILLGTPGTRVPLPGPRSPATVAPPTAPRRPTLTGVPTEASSFIGRTTLLSRLGTALAAGPGAGGLVLLGMPGIGKTAVAAEAVHRYGGRFPAVTWHRATRQGSARSLTQALAGPGAGAGLAGAGDAIRARELLLVIDDAQLLLDRRGAWRDELGRLIAALSAPGSRSRLVLIADRPLPGLPPGVASHLVPMLSRSESEWLARERQETRLAAGASGGGPGGVPWLVCRGHPELIGYCSGGPPGQDRRRARRIDEAWEIITPLAPGPAAARPPLGRDHPGTRLAGWARDRAAALPGPARRALTFLAAIEQADRTPDHTALAWQLLAADTGVDTGRLDEAIGPAEQAGLVERSGTGRFLLHPAVVQAGRALHPELHEHTLRIMYVIWDHYYRQVQDEGGRSQQALAHCTAAQVPYLMRLGQWEQASQACERAINHDGSPATAGRLLPYDMQIVRAAQGLEIYPAVLFVYMNLLRTLDEGRGQAILTQLLEQAGQDGDDLMVMVTASALATTLAGRDPARAYELLQRARSSRAAAEHQAWATIRLRNIEVQIRFELGDWAGALAQSQAVLDDLARLTPADMAGWAVNPHSERGVALSYAEAAASALGEHGQAAGFRAQLRAHDQSSGQRAASGSGFNEMAELIRVGRLDEAYDLLVAALGEFSEPGDTGRQGLVLIQLARVEHLRGHPADAIALGRRALRASYTGDQPLDAAAAHGSMANFLAAGPAADATEAPVHILAAAVIHLRVSQGLMALAPPPPALQALARLTHCLARQPDLVSRSFAGLRERLQATTGVDIETLLAGLDRVPVTAGPEPHALSFALGAQAPPPGDSVTDALIWASRRPPPEELTDVDGHPQHWQPVIEMTVTAAGGDLEAQQAMRQLLNDYRGMGWAGLAGALDAFLTDPEAFTPSSSLPLAERAILRRVLDAFLASDRSG
jgi:tetratricopeptide (TPR) repeat protein